MRTEDLKPDWKAKPNNLKPSLQEKLFIKRFFKKTNRLPENEKIDWNKAEVKLMLELLRYIQNLS
jgi:hypothetical protein